MTFASAESNSAATQLEMATREYLLAKYLSPNDDAPEAKKRKKKRPKAPAGATVGIVDDDADDAWKTQTADVDDRTKVIFEDAGEAAEEEAEEERPRFRRVGGDSEDEEESRAKDSKNLGAIYNSDDEPPRGAKRRHDSDSEGERRAASRSPRRRRHDSDNESAGSPPRKRRHDSRSRSRSPRHRGRHDSRSPSPKREPTESVVDKYAGPTMADGSAAGLQRAADLRREAEARKADEMKRLAGLSSEASGRNATTVYRDKTGRKVDMATKRAEDLAEERRKEAEEEAKMVWGKGIAQHREKEEEAARLAREGAKPLARYVDDREMNEEMMDRDRWGDPMAGLVSKKKKVHRPLYKGPPAPPNRFGILPGYRWDGVQRDNGFEAKLFQLQNTKASKAEAAYRWSTEDM